MHKCKLEECTNLTNRTYCSRSCSNRGRHRDPEFSSKFKQSVKNSYTDELKSQRSDAAVEMWKNPEYREFHTQRSKEWFNNPDNYSHYLANLQIRMSNPEYRSKIKRILTDRNKSASQRMHVSRSLLRRWKTSYKQMYLAVHGNPQKKLDDEVYFYVFESDDGKYIKIGEGGINRLMVRLVTFHKPPAVLVKMARQDALALEKIILKEHLLVTSKDDIPMDMYHSGKGEVILSENLGYVMDTMSRFTVRPPEHAVSCLFNELSLTGG